MDASLDTSVQTLAGIGAPHDLVPVHQWSIPRARRELVATGETVRTRSVETRDELLEVVAPAYRRSP